MNAQLRAPGEPRADTPKIPGFGICDHPEHGTAVWLVTGLIIDGKAIGRCEKHRDAEPHWEAWKINDEQVHGPILRGER